MNKRSALLVASGLVIALVAAGLGLMLGVTGPTQAHGARPPKRRPPIVKRVTDTKTIHVPASGQGGTTTVAQGPSQRSSDQLESSQGGGSTDGAAGGSAGDTTEDPSTPTPSPEPGDGSGTPSPEPGDD